MTVNCNEEQVSMEIYFPEVVAFTIPQNKPDAIAPLRLSIWIENNGLTPIPFVDCAALKPEIISAKGQVIQGQEPSNKQLNVEDSSCGVSLAGQKIWISRQANLFWQNNSLNLLISSIPTDWNKQIKPKQCWSFAGLEPGTYQIRFIYDAPSGEFSYFDIKTRENKSIEASLTNRLITSWAQFRLVPTLECNPKAIEVDGIIFETLVPKSRLTIPKKKLDKEIRVKFGLRITNNTSTPFRFIFHSNLMPSLVLPERKVQLGTAWERNLVRQPEESDFLLAMPGESVTFFPQTFLSWNQKKDKFSLVFHSGEGGWRAFGEFKAGKYQVHFCYQASTILPDSYQQIASNFTEQVWTGQVYTPLADFDLVKP